MGDVLEETLANLSDCKDQLLMIGGLPESRLDDPKLKDFMGGLWALTGKYLDEVHALAEKNETKVSIKTLFKLTEE